MPEHGEKTRRCSAATITRCYSGDEMWRVDCSTSRARRCAAPDTGRSSWSVLVILVGVFALFSLPAACGGPTFIVQQYEGSPRPRDAVAIVRLNGDDPIQVLDIDRSPTNVRVGSGTRVHIEVLPGEHTVTVIDAEHPNGTSQFVRFRTEPGKLYRALWLMQANHTPGLSDLARVYEVDASSDTPLQDASIPWRSDDFTPAINALPMLDNLSRSPTVGRDGAAPSDAAPSDAAPSNRAK
jgi:hypothetical protein